MGKGVWTADMRGKKRTKTKGDRGITVSHVYYFFLFLSFFREEDKKKTSLHMCMRMQGQLQAAREINVEN